MEGKKISFGFNKLSKKSIVISKVLEEPKKVELVECLEGKSIKIKDAVEEVKEPLIIPIKANKANILDRIRDARSKHKDINKKTEEEEDNRPNSELTIEELAAKELLREAKLRLTKENPIKNGFELPLTEKMSLEGEEESTLEDYEAVPINDYGLAMLRGMGWKEGTGIGKNASKTVAVVAPELRPKGLGLGASKMIKSEIPAGNVDKDGKELILVKGAFAKVIVGTQKGNYCEVLGLDDEAGRVIVKTSLKGDILTLAEFMLIPVTKEEYVKSSKVLNNAKYEEYKEISDKKLESHKQIRRDLENSREDKKQNGKYDEDHLEIKKEPRSKSRYEGVSKNKSDESEDDQYSKEKDIKRSRSKDRRNNDKYSKYRQSPDSDHERKSRKHKKSKSKNRNRSRSGSTDEDYKSSKKSSKSKHKNRSSSSESEYYKEKRKGKKNKCKSRHRRSSSSEDNRDYRKNKTR